MIAQIAAAWGKSFGQAFGRDPVEGALPAGDDGRVDGETPRAKATLEVVLAGQAPAGELKSAAGVRREFSGWTELASVIEEWRSEADRLKGEPDGSDQ